jgi:acyl-CoA synthetase (AMP-forming)/AMP-acid ligase II
VPAAVIPSLRKWARATPDDLAFTCFREGTGAPATRTYAELEARAASIGAGLISRFAAGTKALLLYPPGPEFIDAFFGVLWSGLVAIPVPSPSSRPGRTTPRLLAIARDAGATLILTTQVVADAAASLLESDPELKAMTVVATDRFMGPAVEPRAPAGSVAMLQYTSGSTSTPKGVMLTHENLDANLVFFHEGYQHQPGDVFVNWLPHFHDLGLLYGVLEPVFTGRHAVQLPPIDVMKRPLLWLETMSKFGGTHSMGPNFMYELCLRKIAPAERQGLDLQRWRMALNAAEPVRWSTMVAFTEAFAPAGFRFETFSPGYGLSEATCKVTTTPPNKGPTSLVLETAALEHHRVQLAAAEGPKTTRAVASGAVQPGCEIAIVEPDTLRRCAPDQVGEIWLKGPSIGAGYWGNVDAAFGASIAGEAAGGYLRTGDLGFVRDGHLFITGRHKDLIIIRGENHYPQDIELTAQTAHAVIRPGCVAAFSVDRNGEEQVIVVAEAERRTGKERRAEPRSGTDRRVDPVVPEHTADGLVPEEIRRAVVTAVSRGHELRVHEVVLIKSGTIPKTSSGKIQRRPCRTAYLQGELELVDA